MIKISTRIVLDIATGKLLEAESFDYEGPLALAGKGGSSGSSSTVQEIPAELKPLYAQTGTTLMGLQNENPISNYLGANPTPVAGLSGLQNKSLGLLSQNLSDATTPLEQSPIAQAGTRYFQSSIAPGITNQATLSGLGRSTANTNALAAAQAQIELPLLQAEQARRDQLINQGLAGGDVQRSVEQQGYNSEAMDYARRQALAEQSLFGPMGQLPSTFGQRSTQNTSGGGGGFLKALIPFLVPIASVFLYLSTIS